MTTTLNSDIRWSMSSDVNGSILCIFDNGFYSPALFIVAIRNTLAQINIPEYDWHYDNSASTKDMMVIRFDKAHFEMIKMLMLARYNGN